MTLADYLDDKSFFLLGMAGVGMAYVLGTIWLMARESRQRQLRKARVVKRMDDFRRTTVDVLLLALLGGAVLVWGADLMGRWL